MWQIKIISNIPLEIFRKENNYVLSEEATCFYIGKNDAHIRVIFSGFRLLSPSPSMRSQKISERFRQFCFFTKRSTLLLEKSRKINFLHLFFIEQHAKLLPFLLMLVY